MRCALSPVYFAKLEQRCRSADGGAMVVADSEPGKRPSFGEDAKHPQPM